MREDVHIALKKIWEQVGSYNPFVIAEKYNFEISYHDFKGSPLGHCSTVMGQTIILMDKSLENSNKRFLVCGHEIYHGISHQDIASYYSINGVTKGKMEDEANGFSVELLKCLYFEEHGRHATYYKELSIYGIGEDMLEYL
ncbi:ImmA/IrrE family metallo-endopeptidase [Vagococcus elongatus]|uniref:IrrE N-terminal-like domain-containing protein n=1 Tax=Vagococcus elongatus TaxID=180344 RepID=A0A430AU62_9ENTE|nr:hypothetical protein [Vagococcus elongatus]RSU11599.1 hypothetical protein CBF29_07940 [Vagococcus elongatus]